MKRRIFNGAIMIFLMLVFVCNIMNVKSIKADSINDAVSYTVGTTAYGVIAENGSERQFYRFTLNESGKIQISGTAYMEWVYLYLYDSKTEELWDSNPHWNSTSEVISVDEQLYLTSGTYYFCVGRDGDRYGNYNFKINFTSSNETFIETNGGSNNSIDMANTIQVNGTSYNAQLARNDEKDFWKFTLAESGKVNFNATFYNMEYVYWNLFDENGNELMEKNPYYNSTTTNIVLNEDLFLTKGIYYISVSADGNRYGKYTFSLPFTSSNVTYEETNGGSNNIIGNASNLKLGNTYIGELAINDEKDFYKVSLPSSGSYVVSLTSPARWVYVKLFDSNGEELWSGWPEKSSTTNSINYSRNTVLIKGTYYVAVVRYGDYSENYTLSMAKLTKENCPHEEYNSVWRDATYFSKGYRQYTCKDCGYSYKTDYESVRKLSQPYLYSSSITGKGSLRLSWSTVYDASGYQVRYATKKAMKSGVVTKTIKGQSKSKKTIKNLSRKKKYYVQIRAYKTSGAKTVYSSWSSKMTLKTR
jgi:hypothetical protein